MNLVEPQPPPAEQRRDLLTQAVELTAHVATSWFGLATAYFAALAGAVVAYQKLEEPLKGTPSWVRPVLAVAPLLLVLSLHGLPTVIGQRRRRRLTELSGDLKSGYFQLAPREEPDGFARADNKHEEILHWLAARRSPILYLTGKSGSGKSSLLAAWVVPKLSQQHPSVQVVKLRGYQDPMLALKGDLENPGVIWQRPPAHVADVRELLERACKQISPRRLLLVFDQFEEFLLLHDQAQRDRFECLLASFVSDPIEALTVLLVLRSDYIGLLEKLSLPKLAQETNWREVPSFTESAARRFLLGSGIQISDELLRGVLREAGDVEQTKGLIRPVTINLCGLVLGRFANGLPRGFRSGTLIRGFLEEALSLPEIREVTPKIVPHMITDNLTKRPQTVTELAHATGFGEAAVRGCFRTLGQTERGIVRALDPDQETWEISHDFLVPLLDSIIARWSVSFWRRVRPWVPWIAAATLGLVLVALSISPPDPLARLVALGWGLQRTETGDLELMFDHENPPFRESLDSLRRVGPLWMKVTSLNGIQVLRELRSLTELDIRGTKVTDLAPLRELRSLTVLDLTGTKVTDLAPLCELRSLTKLDISGTNVTDLAPLRELRSLTELDIPGTEVTDLAPLRELKSLTKLNISGTNVTDLAPLRQLRSLTVLDLIGTKVTDLAPLRELKSLTVLDLTGTNVTNLAPLRELKSLTTLNISGTKVTDLAPLRQLRSLTNIDIRNTNVTYSGIPDELKLRVRGWSPRH
jgi:hypothetical protein